MLTYDRGIDTTLLTHDEATADALLHVAEPRFREEQGSLVVRVVEGHASDVVRELRAEVGGQPIGYCARSQEDVLDALTAGADEAVVLPNLSAATIHGFVDRTLLRASLRRSGESQTVSFAQTEKLAALGTLVAGVAHEINNPLSAVTLSLGALHACLDPLVDGAREAQRLSSLGRPVLPSEIQRLAAITRTSSPAGESSALLKEIQSACDIITDVVKDLHIFARTEDAEPAEVVDIHELIDNVLRLVAREIERTAVIEKDFAADMPRLLVPRTRIAQVLTNVLINAAHAVREVDRPGHRVRIATRADDEAIAITVADTGPGIPPDTIDQIFDPFFTTKREKMGTGLGLSISRSILRGLGGDLVVESVYGDGAEFVILLPAPDPTAIAAAVEPAAPKASATNGRRLSILIVDDDERMLRVYARVLGRDHNVILASDGEEAVELLESGSMADVVLCEVSVRGLDGPQLYDWLKRSRPDLAAATLFVTALHATERYQLFLGEVDAPVLTKPIDRRALLSEIERVAGD